VRSARSYAVCPPCGSDCFAWSSFSPSLSQAFRFISNTMAQTLKAPVGDELRGRRVAICPISTRRAGSSLGHPGLCLRSPRPNAVGGMKNVRELKESSVAIFLLIRISCRRMSSLDYADWLSNRISALFVLTNLIYRPACMISDFLEIH